MATTVEVKGVGMVEFPDSMTPEQINQALQQQFSSDLPELDAPPPRTLSEQIFRGLGLTARDVAEGAAGIAGIVTDPIGFTVNKASEALGGPQLSSQNLRGDVGAALTNLGVPEPQGRLEEIGSAINQGIVGAGGFVGAGRTIAANAPKVASEVGKVLAAAPGTQAASFGASSGAVESLPEDTPTLAKAGVGLVAAATPALAGTLSQAGVRGAFRGRSPQKVQKNIETFERAGTAPTVPQATQGRIAQAAESGLSRAPGAAGIVSRKATQQADEVAARVQKRADELAPKATPERAGAAIETGIKGKGGFVEKKTAIAKRLYDDVDNHIDTSKQVATANTEKFFSDVAGTIKGAPSTAQILNNQFLSRLGVALSDDLAAALQQSGAKGLPYSTLKSIRTKVGERLSNLTLVDDVSKAELKRLYGALSEDLTASVAGNPKALQAARRADAFWRGFRTRIDNVERVVNKNGGPEKVFSAALSGTKDGATTLRTVMKSLGDQERRMVTAAVIRRLGKATPGQQDASTEAFSIGTYLTNWARLSPEARSTLFGTFGPKFQKNMGALANFASNVRAGSQVFANPSGTQQAITLQGTTGGALAAVIFGQLNIAAGIVGLVGGANLSARLMTNPNFVNWLAVATKAPQGAFPAQLNNLANVARQTKDDDLALAVSILEQEQ